MSSFSQCGLLTRRWHPLMSAVRYKAKINLKRPQKPHYRKARLIEVCKPRFINPVWYLPLSERCEKGVTVVKTELENPLERLQAKDLLNWFNHSKMIAFYHTNSINSEEDFKAKILFKRQNMFLKRYGKKIVKLAIEDTKFEPLLPLFESVCSMVFSAEPQMAKLLKVNKKIPQLSFMTAVVEDHTLNKDDFVRISRIPDLATAQAQLVSTVNLGGSLLSQTLVRQQQILVNHIDEHMKLMTVNKDGDNAE